MNIVNIGTDKSLVGGKKLGDSVDRHRKYGELLTSLDIIVYTNRKEKLNKFKISDRVIGHPSQSKYKILFIFDAIKVFNSIAEQKSIDLIVCQDPFIPGIVGYILKKKYRTKLQINFHGDFWKNTNWLKERWINPLFFLLSQFTVRQADAIRVMSNGQKTKLVKSGIPEKKIWTISTPVNLDRFITDKNPNLTSRLKKENFKKGFRKTILMVGRKDPVKDFDTLFEACSLVFKSYNSVGLRLVGNYKGYSEIPLKSTRVLLSPSVDTSNIPSYYHSSDLFVLSSQSESFGKVIVEANASGLPVVSTSTTGAQDLIVNKKNGILVPIGDSKALADSIIYLLNNEGEIEELGNNGRIQMSKRFSRDANFRKMLHMWRSIINNQDSANN